MPMLRLFVIGFAAILTTADTTFADSLTNRAPNYADNDAWAAWPGRASGADAAPPGALDEPTRGKVDVFFVHPTTYLLPAAGNATYDAPGIPQVAIDRTVLRFQAGAFNACCRIFAPHYRQASLGAFLHEGHDSEMAIDLAYSDVRRAFDYYLARENNGRPFIIASHSQGSVHAMRLLQERIAGTPLQQRMVAAYLVGYSIPEEIEQAGIPVCEQPLQTGCVVHWATVRQGESTHPVRTPIWLDGHYQPVGDHKLVCINPLNWRRDGAAPASANLGALPRVAPMQSIPRPLPAVTGAVCDEGMLNVSIPPWERWRFSDVLTWFGSYHDFDYHLFYMNIRRNAAERVAAYLAQASADMPRGAGAASLANGR
jgi:Protein of unknown function (DUF3089)